MQGRQDPTQGRQDPTQGRRVPMQGRQDPTQGRRVPTQGRRDPTQGRWVPTQGPRDPTTSTALPRVPPRSRAAPTLPYVKLPSAIGRHAKLRLTGHAAFLRSTEVHNRTWLNRSARAGVVDAARPSRCGAACIRACRSAVSALPPMHRPEISIRQKARCEPTATTSRYRQTAWHSPAPLAARKARDQAPQYPNA